MPETTIFQSHYPPSVPLGKTTQGIALLGMVKEKEPQHASHRS